jgi:cell division protein FtsL
VWDYWRAVLRDVWRGASSHFIKKTALGLLLSVIAMVIQFWLGLRTLSDTEKVCLSLIYSTVIVFGGSFVYHFVLVPFSRHKEQDEHIKSLNNTISDQQKEHVSVVRSFEQTIAVKDEALRRKHGIDEDRENEVKILLTNFTPHEINVLRLLLRIGEISEGKLSTAEDRRAIDKGIGCSLVKDRIEPTPGGNYIFFFINPTLENALKNVLHPPTVS